MAVDAIQYHVSTSTASRNGLKLTNNFGAQRKLQNLVYQNLDEGIYIFLS